MAEDELGRVRCKSARPGRRTSVAAFAGEAPGADDPLLRFAPYEHVAPRRNSITRDRQVAFVAALARTGIVTQAAREVGVSLEALYKLRHKPGADGFAAAWDAAVDRGMARLEDCALERAIAGEERVIVRGGEVVAKWVRYDTQLITFLLRHRRQERYRAAEAMSRAEVAAFREQQRAQKAREAEVDEKAVYESINAKLDLMRERMMAARGDGVAGAGDGDGGGD